MLLIFTLTILTTTAVCEHSFKSDQQDIFKSSHISITVASENQSEEKASENRSVYICKDLIGMDFPCVNIDPRCVREDWGPGVFTYERMCGKCLGNAAGWTLYLFLATFPTTIFFLIVVGCGIKATSAPMNAFVCISQIALCSLSINLDYYKKYAPQIYSKVTKCHHIEWAVNAIFSSWNLDFFRFVIPPFCISKSLSSIHVLAMEYIVAVYPLVFIVLTYTCIELHDKDFKPLVYASKPFKWCFACLKNWNPKLTIIEAFATFFILGYSKVLFTSFNFLVFTTRYVVVNDSNESSSSLVHGVRVMLYDPSIEYLNSKHIPFFILSIMFLIILNVLPFLILLLYPTQLFQKALGCCTRIQWHPLHAFVDAIQGCYKNGTNGTSDCRYFSALYLLVRVFYRVPEFAIFSDSPTFASIFVLISHTFCMLIGVIRPYKNDFYNKWDMIVFFLLPLGQLWYSVYLKTIGTVTEAILILIFTVYFILGTVYKTLSLCAPRLLNNCKRKCLSCYKYLINEQSTNPDERLESDDEIVRVHDDEDYYPDRLMNPGPQEYKALLVSAQTSAQQQNSFTGCHYTYGTLQ